MLTSWISCVSRVVPASIEDIDWWIEQRQNHVDGQPVEWSKPEAQAMRVDCIISQVSFLPLYLIYCEPQCVLT